jgi:hypothetical protein
LSSPTLFIHIGIPKTGSTSIQQFATDHRQLLAKHGVLYPETALRGLGHHDLAFLIHGSYPEWAIGQNTSLASFKNQLADECRHHRGDILLSSENFYLFPEPEKLYSFIKETGLDRERKIRVLAFIRRQDSLLISWYNQMVKAQGFTESIQDSLESSYWLGKYDSNFRAWESVFGKKQLTLIPIESLINNDSSLPLHFWSIVCPLILDKIPVQKIERVNISLNRDLLEIQKLINRLPITIFEKRKYHKKLMQLSRNHQKLLDNSPLMTDSERIGLLKEFATENRQIARRYFYGNNPYEVIENNIEESAQAYPGLTVEKTIAVITWLIFNE